ncbi:oxidoreductase [Nocardiopsis kunsanensis]|uniref:Oxidoreductase n=1 Tax=Nocardiopsis kunsanensis TaxID=141693 RepID=A0A918X8L7_9ACTN|nr:zinc-binding dehydrogenase [Nocardiopsis kunsanensis]GHD17613.1 oxidoreductase [Nocardiopsis kunsanensis]
MFAAYIDRLGSPDVISHGELARPRPGHTDVLVDVEVTTVNHVDTFVRSGAWRTPIEFPFVIGRDLVGTVAGTGAGATSFTPGDRVWSLSMGYAGRQGSAAESVVVPAERLYHLPTEADGPAAVALAHPAATAHLALFTHGRARPGETVVVVGAAGNVGGAAVVLAAHAGARVIAVASGRDAEYCASLGANTHLDASSPDLHERLAKECPAGVDLYIDAAGRNEADRALGTLARRGRLVLLAGMADGARLPVGSLYLRDRSVIGFAISQATVDELAEAARNVGGLVAAGRLAPRRLEHLPLAEAARAHRRLESGEGRGKRFVLHTGSHSAGT